MSQSLSQQAQPQVTGNQPVSAPVILRLAIKRYRGIKALTWRPGTGLNLILGGGDVGKTTILDAVALLFPIPTARRSLETLSIACAYAARKTSRDQPDDTPVPPIQPHSLTPTITAAKSRKGLRSRR